MKNSLSKTKVPVEIKGFNNFIFLKNEKVYLDNTYSTHSSSSK
jgi:hypothetical protein